jgi:hypothetical protein
MFQRQGEATVFRSFIFLQYVRTISSKHCFEATTTKCIEKRVDDDAEA